MATTPKLLLVEADSDLCRSLKGFFERESYSVDVAVDAPSALELIESCRPHLALVDIGLARDSGVSLLREIRQKDPALPLIVLTGRTEEEVREASNHLGAVYCVTKPFTLDYLKEEVLGAFQKHALNELREKAQELLIEREKWELVFQRVREGVLLAGPSGRIVAANPYARNLLNLPDRLGELTLQRVFERFLDLDGRKPFANSNPLEIRPFDCVQTQPRRLVLECDPNPILTPQNELKGQIILLRDVTDVRLEVPAQHHFLSFISHKLRTPLAFIRMFPGLCRQEFGSLNKKQENLVKTLESKCVQMQDMIDQLISFVSLNLGGMTRRPVSLRALLREAEKLTPANARGKDGMTFAESLDKLIVSTDRTLVAYAFRNLIDNAFKFGSGRLSIDARTDNGFAIVAFTDDGPGVPAEELGNIFEPFYQVEKGFTGQVPGAGLGLTVVREVARAHGGDAWAESKQGKGSTFYVRLPLATSTAELAAQDPIHPHPHPLPSRERE